MNAIWQRHAERNSNRGVVRKETGISIVPPPSGDCDIFPLRYTQYLIHEIGPQCNLARSHCKCPSGDRDRYGQLDTSTPLSDDVIVENISKAYQMQFAGQCGFHYYNEPLVYWKRLKGLLPKIKASTPQAEFILWTNGTLIDAVVSPSELSAFSSIWISNYIGADWFWIKEHVKDVHVVSGQLDDRKTTGRENLERCLRPYNELIIDAYGNAHLCCADWKGECDLGNVHKDGFECVVAKFAGVRKLVSESPLPQSAPAICKTCNVKQGNVGTLVKPVASLINGAIQVSQQTVHRQLPDMASHRSKRKGQIPSDAEDRAAWFNPRTWKSPPINTCTKATRPATDFKLFALISTWYESDIVEAQIKNCFVHGCDRVLILDNDSPDETREEAIKSGAEIAHVYTTDFYREELRLGLINKIIADETARTRDSCIWWLTVDCDELIYAPNKQSVRSVLQGVDDSCNTVGCYAFDHYPTIKPENIRGFHPVVFQPCGVHRLGTPSVCARNHWKHPLIKVSNGEVVICQTRGLHRPFAKGRTQLVEPEVSLYLHHFMFREEAFTRKRLTALCKPSESLGGIRRSVVDDDRIQSQGAVKRFRHLDNVYAQNWPAVEMCHSQAQHIPKVGIDVKHWTELLPPSQYEPLMWHTEQDALEASKERIK